MYMLRRGFSENDAGARDHGMHRNWHLPSIKKDDISFQSHALWIRAAKSIVLSLARRIFMLSLFYSGLRLCLQRFRMARKEGNYQRCGVVVIQSSWNATQIDSGRRTNFAAPVNVTKDMAQINHFKQSANHRDAKIWMARRGCQEFYGKHAVIVQEDMEEKNDMANTNTLNPL